MSEQNTVTEVWMCSTGGMSGNGLEEVFSNPEAAEAWLHQKHGEALLHAATFRGFAGNKANEFSYEPQWLRTETSHGFRLLNNTYHVTRTPVRSTLRVA